MRGERRRGDQGDDHTTRYDEEAAELACRRSLDFFARNLR